MYSLRALAATLAAGSLIMLTAGLSWAGTIGPGQTRVVTGSIAAVDVAHRALLIEVPTPKGDLTVGVTLAPGVEPQTNGASLALSQVAVGDQAELRYTREDGRLIGLRLDVRR